MSIQLITRVRAPRLDTLPTEVLDAIIANVLNITDPICALIQTAYSPHESLGQSDNFDYEFQQCLPKELRAKLQTLVNTNHSLRMHAHQYLARTIRFYGSSDHFDKFPQLFGSQNARMIRFMDLEMDTGYNHEEKWPRLLELFAKELPNLKELKLTRTSDNQWGSTSLEEDRAYLLRFGSFLTARHPKLKRLIWPAQCNSEFEDETGSDESTHACIILDQGMIQQRGDYHREWNNGNTETEPITEDEVLDATAIRRLKIEDLVGASPTDFVICPSANECKNNIHTSEVVRPTDVYRIIDERGYTAESIRNLYGWGQHTVDALIEFCAEMSSREWTQEQLLWKLADERGNKHKALADLEDAEIQRDSLEQESKELSERLHWREAEVDTLEEQFQSFALTIKETEEEVRKLRAQLVENATLKAIICTVLKCLLSKFKITRHLDCFRRMEPQILSHLRSKIFEMIVGQFYTRLSR